MRIIALIFLLLLSNIAFSQTLISGEIKRTIKFYAADAVASLKRHKFEFPRKRYQIIGIYISHFSYDVKWPNNDRKIDLKKHRGLFVNGVLDLVSYDKESGLYKFSLSMTPDRLVGNDSYMPTNGKIKIDDNEDSCFIEGKVSYIDNKPYLTNIPNNKQLDCNVSAYMHLDEASEYIELTLQKDIPVTIILE